MAATPVTADALDPLIHVPARLQIVATLAALPDGDALSFPRLQYMIGLTPGNLITHLRKLADAGYLASEKSGNGPASRTSVALTHRGRAALTTYTATIRRLLDGLWRPGLAARRRPPITSEALSVEADLELRQDAEMIAGPYGSASGADCLPEPIAPDRCPHIAA